MQPQIVRAVLDAQGRETRVFEPKAVRQVISPGDRARADRRSWSNVVREGTGHNAAIPGYDVAGKTGTAQKMDPATRRYSRAPGVLSFVGFVPADDPRLAMIVLLDEPKNEKWGSEAAAPIFSAIGREALRHLNVPPARHAARCRSCAARWRRALRAPAGPRAGGPRAGRRGRPGRRRRGRARRRSPPRTPPRDAVMPRLAGQSLRQAMDALAPFDVRLEITGRGVVTSQSPLPGAPLPPGRVCRLQLRPRLAGRPSAALGREPPALRT